MTQVSTISKFPNSARAAWLLRNARKHQESGEDRERRLLARELARDLREATMEQLHQVAAILGRTPRWIQMVRLEARRPGVYGKACLRACR